jgi:hypothetical protein
MAWEEVGLLGGDVFACPSRSDRDASCGRQRGQDAFRAFVNRLRVHQAGQ